MANKVPQQLGQQAAGEVELLAVCSAPVNRDEMSTSYQVGRSARHEEAGSLLPPRSGESTTTSSNGSCWSDSSRFHRLAALGCVLGVGIVAFASGSLWQRAGPRVVDVDSESEKSQHNVITVELEGKKKDGSHSKSKTEPTTHLQCDDGRYSKRTLKLAYELPFASLFKDTKGQRKYEASSVVVVGENAYAVCDSSWAISKFSRELQPFDEANVQIGNPGREEEDSGYEALIHNDGTFYVVRESIQHDDSTYHAIIEELELGDDDYDIKAQCSAEFEFEGDSKGTRVLWMASRLLCLHAPLIHICFYSVLVTRI